MVNGRSQIGGSNGGHSPPYDSSQGDDFECSHVVRLSGRQWLFVVVMLLAVIGLGPTVWNRFEGFQPGSDYRMPYELSSDYWLWRRHCGQACERNKILVVGDSVIWGHYVPPNETLAHYLNEFAGAASTRSGAEGRFANLGLDGTHPAALAGLLQYYGAGLSGRTVVLHFNPLWLTSPKHDLQTDKEFRFNHAELVSQFAVKIPCYKASTAQRLRIVARRDLPFANWVAHLRAVYYQGKDLQTWTLEHPYNCPVMPVTRGLPQPGGIPEPWRGRPALARAEGVPPSDRGQDARDTQGQDALATGVKKQSLSWVTLDSSLQWQFFRQAIERLRERGNKVFVLVGPFNEHMLNDADAALYSQIKTQAAAWFQENRVPYFVPEPLPAAHYVDASHPIGEGYALLAQELLNQPAFQALLASQ